MAGISDLKILVVDDNAHMRAILVTMLKSLGVRHVAEAKDGGAAFAALARWPADIAFVDLLMHPMDGLEFTRRVRNTETSPNPYLPIVMISSHADMTRVAAARDTGVTEFLVKPVTGKAVIDRLNAVIYRPRDFIRADDYFGPNRRRVAGASPLGRDRRAGAETDNVTEI